MPSRFSLADVSEKKTVSCPVHQSILDAESDRSVKSDLARRASTRSGTEGSEPVRFGSSPMKACMVAYTGYDSDNRVRRYAETLAKQGCRVDAIALGGSELAPRGVLNGVQVFRIQHRIRNEKSKFAYLGKLLLFFIRSMFLLMREHMKEPYDLIHVHTVPDFEVFAAWYPKLSGAKIILDIHDILPEFYASKFNASPNSIIFKLLVAMERMSTAFSDHVIAANHIWEERLKDRSVDSAKCTTFLNYPDTDVFKRQGRNRNDKKFVLLYPGSINHHQGLDIGIRAFALIKDQVPNAEFHIYGTNGDQLSLLRGLIPDLGLEGRVYLKDSIPFDKIPSVIENADLGIVPKRKSGFGNEAFSTKILEFMYMNVPVIVPNTAIDIYYFNESVVKFFQAEDEQSLADAMLLLINNAELRKSLVRNASDFVRRYTWDVNQGSYLDLVESLVHRNGHQA
jgi:glycosyltransferase involved in cell wall biosynthesis